MAMDHMTVKVAALWLFGWTLVASVALLLLWSFVSWRQVYIFASRPVHHHPPTVSHPPVVSFTRQATLLGVCFALNGMLSADNLFVFMLLLQKVVRCYP